MARSHRMTPKRRAALRKAQAVSARKRRGRGKGKLAAAHRSNNRLRTGLKIAGAAAAIGAVAYGAHHFHGVAKRHKSNEIRAAARDRIQTRAHIRGFVDAANKMRHSNLGLSRRQRAQAKLAHAAKGTSGSHKRVFVSQRSHFVAHAPKPQKALPRGRGLSFTVSKPKSKKAANRARRISVHESVMGTPKGYNQGLTFKVSSSGRVTPSRSRRGGVRRRRK